MAITVCPVTANFAAEIGDVDLSRPLASADVASIKQAFWDYAVLIFPGQELSEEQHLDFARHFGPLETSIAALNPDAKLRLSNKLADVSNLNSQNEIWGERSRVRMLQLANRLWHTDSSFKYLPARASLLYALAIPPVGGHTEFADLRAAYDALSDDLKRRLEGLVAEHALAFSRARIGFSDFTEAERNKLPPVPQMMARTLPENGRKSLYIASHAGRIVGMPEAEGRALIEQLIAHATQRQFVYTHRWRLHDLVMWDDRCTMHRGTEFDDLRWTRDVRRATVSDLANTCEQQGIAVVRQTGDASASAQEY
ncbi:MAG TPA: TauD/TfdA family dioxygenase [Candidatus Binataceae bacterium]|jgi:alpha-ketoglutarate-dependent 2,4-dichlorophenoxyacetate dioxygenase|nr:TauD/TfdA family dioxygenase [Candidatus Binataceae bacterium]